MKNLVSALRRNAEVYDASRKAQLDADNAAFRRKFASAFGAKHGGQKEQQQGADAPSGGNKSGEQGDKKPGGKGGKR